MDAERRGVDVFHIESMGPVERAFAEAMHEDCTDGPEHPLSAHSPWSGDEIGQPWSEFTAALARHGLTIALAAPAVTETDCGDCATLEDEPRKLHIARDHDTLAEDLRADIAALERRNESLTHELIVAKRAAPAVTETDHHAEVDAAAWHAAVCLAPAVTETTCPNCGGQPMSPDCAICGGAGFLVTPAEPDLRALTDELYGLGASGETMVRIEEAVAAIHSRWSVEHRHVTPAVTEPDLRAVVSRALHRLPYIDRNRRRYVELVAVDAALRECLATPAVDPHLPRPKTPDPGRVEWKG